MLYRILSMAGLMLATISLHAQRVGIGTTQPEMQLQVAAADSSLLLLNNQSALGTGVSNALYFKTGNRFTGAIKTIGDDASSAHIGFFTNTSDSASMLREWMRIMHDGRVCVGPAETNARLGIYAPTFADALTITNSQEQMTMGHLNTGGFVYSSSPLYLFNNGRYAAMMLSGQGNVSITGTEYPSLPQPASARLYISGQGGSDGTLAIRGTDNVSHFYYGTNEDTYIRGGKSGSLLVLNDLSGNVGVGTSSNVFSKLTVYTPSTLTGIEHTNGTVRLASYAGYGSAQNAYFGTVSNHPLYIMTNNNGNTVFYNGMLAVSTLSTPSRPMHVFQNFNEALGITNFAGTNTWDLAHGNVDGSVPVLIYEFNNAFKSYIRSDDGSYINLSDRRTKENIAAMPGVLSKLLQLQPHTYTMKGAGKQDARLGFISQEVAPLFPELVGWVQGEADSSGKRNEPLLGIHYAGFSVVAVKAIQEQQEQIEALKREISALRELLTNNAGRRN